MEFVKHSPDRYLMPKTVTELIPLRPGGPWHNVITQNFVHAISRGDPLIASAHEGVASVELSNAMIYSGLTKKTIELPLDAELYAAQLAQLVESSRYMKPEAARTKSEDTAGSFH
jgi:hypothetical protein